MCRFILFILFYSVSALGSDLVNPQMVNKIVAYYKHNYQFQGSVLVALEGKVHYFQSSGDAVREEGIPFLRSTRSYVASITKQMTAMAILKLAEKGQLHLNDLVANYVSLPPQWQNIRIFHLLTHSARLPRNAPLVAQELGKKHSLKQIIDSLKSSYPEDARLGEKFAYSNIGFSLLSAVVENVAHQSLATFLEMNFFKRLLMGQTGQIQTADRSQVARGYMLEHGELSAACCFAVENFYGSGDFISTVDDLLNWTQIYALNGPLIDPYYADLFLTPHIETNLAGVSYGYGVNLEDYKGETLVWHTGGIPGYFSELAYLRKSKVTVIILSNVFPEPYINFMRTFRTQILDSLILPAK